MNKRLLVIRLSSMGDVSLVVPALRSVLAAHPDHLITVLTRPAFAVFFEGMERVHTVSADLKARHKGLRGLWRLFRELTAQGQYSAVVDLHNVLRSRILGLLFRMAGRPVYRLDKGRTEKRQYIRHRAKGQLKHTVERYLDVFRASGIECALTPPPYLLPSQELQQSVSQSLVTLGITPGVRLVGIAPHAMHRPKMWGEESMKALLLRLSEHSDIRVLLFGGGAEYEALQALCGNDSGIINLAGKFSLAEEIAIISALELMLSMDSSNMHLAALAGTTTLSIWGGTHPDLGFGPLGQQANIIQPAIELECRPCSVYGNKPCQFAEPKCMQAISVETVYTKICEQLGGPVQSSLQ